MTKKKSLTRHSHYYRLSHFLFSHPVHLMKPYSPSTMLPHPRLWPYPCCGKSPSRASQTLLQPDGKLRWQAYGDRVESCNKSPLTYCPVVRIDLSSIATIYLMPLRSTMSLCLASSSQYIVGFRLGGSNS